jgi:hypothetical protein
MSLDRIVSARGGRRSGLLPLVLFAVAMGWLEGVVVVYIRALLGIAHGDAYPGARAVLARMAALPWLVPTEQSREVATLAMLAAAAWIGAPGARGRVGAFLVVFGVWDIVYYIALWTMLRWPKSVATMDMLFLIPPHPWWYQPVWLPVAISGGMIALGARLFGDTKQRERGR